MTGDKHRRQFAAPGPMRRFLLPALGILLTATACTSRSGTTEAAPATAVHPGAAHSGSGAHSGPGTRPGPAAGSAGSAPAPGPSGDYAPGAGRPAPTRIAPPTSTAEDPVSTIALDVDTASYGYARRVLHDGQLPDPSTVRPEEFMNSLTQDYQQPAGNGFGISTDGRRGGLTPGSDADHLLRIGLSTRARDSADRPAAALTFVVDVSGSMAEPGRLDLVKDSLHTLVDQLRPTDSVALVTFSDEARVIAPMTPMRGRAALHEAIAELHTEGSTNLEDGLVTGYRVARDGFVPGASNRVIVLSDGLANVGDTTADPILARVREEAGKGIALLGVGVGSDYGDALMERLADSGDGFAVYVSEVAQARRVFCDELPAAIEVRAMDAKAQVRFDPAVVASYRLVGFDDRGVADRSFRDDSVDGGEVGPGQTVTALYEVSLRAGADGPLGSVDVHWVDPAGRAPVDAHRELRLGDLDGSDASPWLAADAVAARLAVGLRDGTEDLSSVAAEADRVAERLADPTVADLAKTARLAARLR